MLDGSCCWPFDSRPLFSLLALLVPLPLDVELLPIAPEFRRAFPLELVPFNRKRQIERELVTHELPHGGERQSTFLQLHVLELLVLLVRPAHRPGAFVAVHLERQGRRQLLAADLVVALPRPDRVYLVALRARQAAEPEYQRCRKDRRHDSPREMGEGKRSTADRRQPPPMDKP